MKRKQMELKEKMQIEALERLALLGVDTETRAKFLNDMQLTKVYVNFDEMRLGKFAMTDEEKEMVRAFEEKNGGLVYYIIQDTGLWPDGCPFKRYSFLYVSKYENDWKMDKEECIGRCGTVPAYVVNMENQDFSEVTEIAFELVEQMLINAS